MSLDCMSLDELEALRGRFGTLCDAGKLLQSGGLNPTFDMTPGFMVTMTLPFLMPAHSREDEAALVHVWDRLQADALQAEPKPAELPEAAPPFEAPTDPEPEAPAPETPEPETAVIEQTPAPQVADDSGPSAGGQGSGSIPTPPGAPLIKVWTEDEDTFVIQSFERMRATHNRAAIIQYVATELGRPPEGTKFRCGNKLKPRIDAVYANAEQDLTRRAPDPVPAAAVASAPVRDVQGSGSYADYYAHIRADGWDLGLDQSLMTMAADGWAMGDIALDLGFDGKKVQARFDALTGLTKIHGKKGTTQLRLHSRREVLDWLIKQIPAATKSDAA